MKRNLFILFFTCAVSFAFFQCGQDTSKPAVNADSTQTAARYGGYESQAKWGEHLVSYSGCTDCHTPKKMTDHGPVDDSSMFLAGHPAKMPLPDVDRKEIEKKGLGVTRGLTEWIGPWGVSFAANLTPDSTGIGRWTEDQFLFAIKNGKYKGLPDSRPLLPPMPWQGIKQMTDEELKAVFAYLKTVRPVNNVVPAAMPPLSAPPGR
ncbi:MAG: c-type cytochrome [Chitinophagaceae bacterium]|nr:c-type cytochrome [Chitinophagaceae bacterium]